MSSTILITGGAGFIGSHTCLVLLQAGYRLAVLDDVSNSAPQSLERVMELVGGDAGERLTVIEGDIRSREDLERAFAASLRPHQGGGGAAAGGRSCQWPASASGDGQARSFLSMRLPGPSDTLIRLPVSTGSPQAAQGLHSHAAAS